MKKSGFSLIELALILVVLSFIAVAMLQQKEYERTVGKQAIATSQIEAIQSAIETYAKAFGYYPCPADPGIAEGTTGFGHNPDSGDGDCNPPLPAAQNNLLDDDANGVVMGMIPVRDLSISRELAYDIYGNKLMYAVTEELTFTLAATGQIKILKDYPETPDNIVTENAVYVILSYGEDGIGAYKKDGSGPMSALAMGGTDIVDSAEQNVNHHMQAGVNFDNVFLRYYTHDPDVQFDDQLTWVSKKVEPCKKVKRPWDYNIEDLSAYDTALNSNILLWLDAAEEKTIIMNNGKAVTNGNFATWCDKSAGDTLPAFSYGKNFLSRPATGIGKSNAPGELNVIRFDPGGDGDGMFIDDILNIEDPLPSKASYTAFIVNRYYNGSDNARSLQGRDTANWWLGLDSGDEGHSGGNSVSSNTAGTSWYVSTVVSNAGSSEYFSNGSSAASGISTSAPGRLGLATGGEPLGDPSASSVDIAEVIVFDQAIDPADRDEVETYLSTKWDITFCSGACLTCTSSTPPGVWTEPSTCTCPSGSTSDGAGGCRLLVLVDRIVSGSSCPSGYTLIDTRYGSTRCEVVATYSGNRVVCGGCTTGQAWGSVPVCHYYGAIQSCSGHGCICMGNPVRDSSRKTCTATVTAVKCRGWE